jgi:DNA processing protein
MSTPTKHDQIPFSQLKELPQPPAKLYTLGTLPDKSTKLLAIIGSRKPTDYGLAVCDTLIDGLRGYNISIVSGLALGIDARAHTQALHNNLHTIAIPGSGLDESVLYPASHRMLARSIVENGGLLLSEFEPTFKATKWSFPKRNRIMAGISHATLVIEASERSGTLITARLCTEYNKDLLAVPGSIFSESSSGSNRLIQQGATPITSAKDILDALNIEEEVRKAQIPDLDETETLLMQTLREPLSRDELARTLSISAEILGATLTMLEIKGYVIERNGKMYRTV